MSLTPVAVESKLIVQVRIARHTLLAAVGTVLMRRLTVMGTFRRHVELFVGVETLAHKLFFVNSAVG